MASQSFIDTKNWSVRLIQITEIFISTSKMWIRQKRNYLHFNLGQQDLSGKVEEETPTQNPQPQPQPTQENTASASWSSGPPAKSKFIPVAPVSPVTPNSSTWTPISQRNQLQLKQRSGNKQTGFAVHLSYRWTSRSSFATPATGLQKQVKELASAVP